MHRHCIAHLDLKPDNVLVSMDNPPQRLWITDFSISIWVSDEDEMTEGYAGTPGWMAPEIGHENGPPRMYSPIRADRWSCGKMIQYFTTFGPGFKDADIEGLSSLLMNEDPAKRPSLIDQPLQIKKRSVANLKNLADQGHQDQVLRKKRRLPGHRPSRGRKALTLAST